MIKHCSPLGKMAEITEFLFLGGLAAAKMEDVLTTKGITCVINGKLVITFSFLKRVYSAPNRAICFEVDFRGMSHIRTPDFCFVLIKLELNSALHSSVIVSFFF